MAALGVGPRLELGAGLGAHVGAPRRLLRPTESTTPTRPAQAVRTGRAVHAPTAAAAVQPAARAVREHSSLRVREMGSVRGGGASAASVVERKGVDGRGHSTNGLT